MPSAYKCQSMVAVVIINNFANAVRSVDGHAHTQDILCFLRLRILVIFYYLTLFFSYTQLTRALLALRTFAWMMPGKCWGAQFISHCRRQWWLSWAPLDYFEDQSKSGYSHSHCRPRIRVNTILWCLTSDTTSVHADCPSLENYSQTAKSDHLPTFISKFFSAIQSYQLIYLLFTVTSALQWWSWQVATETIWLLNPKIFYYLALHRKSLQIPVLSLWT